MLIDCSYFTKGARHIQNASLGTMPDPNALQVNVYIEAFIEEHQERFLVRMLGTSLGNKVNAYLVCLDDDEEPKHNEHFDAVCERLRESFADYVFFQILRDSNTQATMTGLVRLKCGNEYVAPIRRQVSVWKAMVERNKAFDEWARSAECPVKGISVSSDMMKYTNILNL